MEKLVFFPLFYLTALLQACNKEEMQQMTFKIFLKVKETVFGISSDPLFKQRNMPD